MDNSDSTPKVPPHSPQDQDKHPIPETPIFEKSVHNIETILSIGIKTMEPTLEHSNHPTIIFQEFMDKKWGKFQTKEGEGVHSEGGDQELPVMDMVIFRTIFFELLVFFTFTLLTLHFAY